MEIVMSRTDVAGVPPAEITATLRLEGFVAFIAALAAFHLTGGNWWLFATLILAPDLSMLGWYAGEKNGARIYNLAHTYTVPALLGAIGFVTGAGWLVSVAIIWIAHIGLDRAIGYGLKYPGSFKNTHLGTMGKHKREAADLADAG
jgi:hypothetical protein